MSLVLDALRRVERSDARTGSVGVSVASYRPARRVGRSWIPLVLGLMAGGAVVFVFGPSPDRLRSEGASGTASIAPGTARRTALGGAGLPPPLLIEPVAPPETGRNSADVQRPVGGTTGLSAGRAAAMREAPKAPAPLVLQAISERESRPIAVISDQLVKEGDVIGRARVLKIGPDSVEVLLESGLKEVVRFAPPPPDPTPSPEGS